MEARKVDCPGRDSPAFLYSQLENPSHQLSPTAIPWMSSVALGIGCILFPSIAPTRVCTFDLTCEQYWADTQITAGYKACMASPNLQPGSVGKRMRDELHWWKYSWNKIGLSAQHFFSSRDFAFARTLYAEEIVGFRSCPENRKAQKIICSLLNKKRIDYENIDGTDFTRRTWMHR